MTPTNTHVQLWDLEGSLTTLLCGTFVARTPGGLVGRPEPQGGDTPGS